jgi:hypothetical protein
MTTITSLTEIGLDELTTDLASEANAYDPENIATRDDLRAYRFLHFNGQRGEALHFLSGGRLGVVMGGNSEWGDLSGKATLDEIMAALPMIGL